MESASRNAARNTWIRPALLTPIWERGLTPSLSKAFTEPAPVGTTSRFMPPPPLPIKRPAVQVISPSVKMPMGRPDKKRRIRWPKLPTDVEEEKAVEIRKWRSIIEAIGPDLCRLADHLAEAQDEETQWKTLAAACYGKAPATLRKHAGALNMYMRWCHASGYAAFPFQEVTIWNYVSFLQETRAPATRADSFMKAAHAAMDITTMYVSLAEITTRRIEGAVLQSLDRKRETHQAPPLSVKAVEAIERAIMSRQVRNTKRLVAGFVRLCIGASLRHSDGTSISQEPMVEPRRVRREKRGYGFIEARGGVLKNTQARGKRRRPVPIAAHSWGLVEEAWAAKWLELRAIARRDAHADGTIMPACGPDWVLVPGTKMTAESLTIILREILMEMGLEQSEVRTYTSHSMKATFLSWAGKCGLKKNVRRVLGRHTKAKDSMPELYVRDEFAEPLRQLGHVVAWVSSRAFLPDATRSGRWTKHPREASKQLSPSASAADFLSLMAPANANATTNITIGHKVVQAGGLSHIPDLPDESSDLDMPPSDDSEPEEDDEVRDQIEQQAAGVILDVRRAEADGERAADTEEGVTRCYAPIHFKVLRHIFRGTRHWSEDGKNLICPSGASGNFKAANYREATTHDDAFCDGCLRAAERDFGVSNPSEYVHGKRV